MDALNSVARALRGSTVGREMEKRTRDERRDVAWFQIHLYDVFSCSLCPNCIKCIYLIIAEASHGIAGHDSVTARHVHCTSLCDACALDVG